MPTLAESLAQRSQDLGREILSKLSPTYHDGVFFTYDMENWHRRGLPHAALMATLVKYETSESIKNSYIQMIREIVNRAIRTNTDSAGLFQEGVNPTGAFANYYGQFPERFAMIKGGFGTIGSIEMTGNLAWILVQMPRDLIGHAERESWLRIVQVNCNRIHNDNNTFYFINGNINCQLCSTYWYTSEATDDATLKEKYLELYESALAFLVAPAATSGSSAWTGWGLTIDVAPVFYDGSDGQAHLTETNSRTIPGADFDTNYSLIQLDALTGIYLMNRDPRVLRLINMISNKVEPKINPTTYVIDGTGGSRQNNVSSVWTSYNYVNALLGSPGTTSIYRVSPKILDMWDVGTKPAMLVNATTGYYSAVHAYQLRMCIAHVREACAMANVKIPLPV